MAVRVLVFSSILTKKEVTSLKYRRIISMRTNLWLSCSKNSKTRVCQEALYRATCLLLAKMEALYHQTNRILQEIEKSFQSLTNASPNDFSTIENDIHMKITTVNSNCDRLDVLLYKVPVTQRPSAKMRVDQLKYDIRHLQNALDVYRQKKQRRQIELSEREQLLNHRFTSNQETCLDIDYALQHNSSLHNAHTGVDEMISTGTNILGSLINQRETLKGAHKRILAIGSTLGLSNHTMKLIERRFVEDKYVMIGGMIVTLLVIVLIIYFVLF